MSDVTSAGAVVAGTKGLWVAVGVLGLAVVGMGGALYSTLQPKTAAEVQAVSALPEIIAPAPVAEKPVVVEPAPVTQPKPRPAPVKKAQAPAQANPAPVAPPVPEPVCADCATVAAVTPFEREVSTSGAGAVAGAVAGAIVGNQVGRGSGRDVARVVGAIGGGIAGNQVEKSMRKVQAYQVELRMDDGKRRTLEVDKPIAVGERVRYDGSTLQPLTR